MIDELRTLECAPYSQRNNLPEIIAVYFVVLEEQVLYIGRSSNLRARWQAHHKAPLMTSDYLIYWKVVNADDLIAIEKEAVDRYSPPWNNKQQPGELYRTLRVYPETWQALMYIKDESGSSLSYIIDRLVKQEEARIKAQTEQKGNAE